MTTPDLAAFIRANMPLAPVPMVPEIVLHTAHPGSGLRALSPTMRRPPPPYWAYQWAGGTVLARYILDHPAASPDGASSTSAPARGLSRSPRPKAGARTVTAAEIDPHGLAALALNADANGVVIAATADDLLGGPPPDADLVAVSDLFYAEDLAQRVLPFLDRCLAAGIASWSATRTASPAAARLGSAARSTRCRISAARPSSGAACFLCGRLKPAFADGALPFAVGAFCARASLASFSLPRPLAAGAFIAGSVRPSPWLSSASSAFVGWRPWRPCRLRRAHRSAGRRLLCAAPDGIGDRRLTADNLEGVPDRLRFPQRRDDHRRNVGAGNLACLRFLALAERDLAGRPCRRPACRAR